MKIKILFGHRKENYEGEYAPEVLGAIDEYSHDNNPSWIIDQFRYYEQYKSFNVLKFIDIEVEDSDIMNALYPRTKIIGGKVK